MELLMVLAVFGYIYYLRNYADLRTKSEKEEQYLKEGINLFQNDQIQEAFTYFDQRIQTNPRSAVAYLFRAKCYKALDNPKAAMQDLNTGLSYDESVFGLHLEKGKLHFGNEQYEMALPSLNKAVFNAGELDPESYYWRALTKQYLNQDQEAMSDFEKEAQILKNRKNARVNVKVKKPFLDRRLVANSLLVVCTSTILIIVVKDAESIHLPYLMAAFSAIAIGYTEPVRGWVLAILQCILMITGYLNFTEIPENGAKRELEVFSLCGSFVLIFAGSFLGSFFKRAIKQG